MCQIKSFYEMIIYSDAGVDRLLQSILYIKSYRIDEYHLYIRKSVWTPVYILYVCLVCSHFS